MITPTFAEDTTNPFNDCTVYGNCKPVNTVASSCASCNVNVTQIVNNVSFLNVAYFNRSNNWTDKQYFNGSAEFRGTNAEQGSALSVHVENSGDLGLLITGDTSDAITVGGEPTWNGIFNVFSYSAFPVLAPNYTNKEYWGYLTAPLILGNSSTTKIRSFYSTPYNRALFGQFKGTADIEHFVAETTWNSGNITEQKGFLFKRGSKTGGKWNVTYAFYSEDVNDSLVGNYVWYSNKGLATWNNKTNITDDGNVTALRFFGNGSGLTDVCLTSNNCATLYRTADPTTGVTNDITGLETGSSPTDVTTTMVALYDPSVGYAQQFTVLDGLVIPSSTYLATTTFGQPARRIDTSTASASTTLSDFSGTVQAYATSAAINVSLPAVSVGREIVIRKMDGSANVVRVNASWYNGSSVIPLTTQYNYMIVQYNGTKWLINGQG